MTALTAFLVVFGGFAPKTFCKSENLQRHAAQRAARPYAHNYNTYPATAVPARGGHSRPLCQLCASRLLELTQQPPPLELKHNTGAGGPRAIQTQATAALRWMTCPPEAPLASNKFSAAKVSTLTAHRRARRHCQSSRHVSDAARLRFSAMTRVTTRCSTGALAS